MHRKIRALAGQVPRWGGLLVGLWRVAILDHEAVEHALDIGHQVDQRLLRARAEL